MSHEAEVILKHILKFEKHHPKCGRELDGIKLPVVVSLMGKKHSQLSFVRIILQISLVWDRRKVNYRNHAKYIILHTNYETAALIGLKSGNVTKPTSRGTQ